MKIEDAFKDVRKSHVEKEWKQSEKSEDPLIKEWIKRKREKTTLD
jgi:hypothetical protein